VLRSRKISQGNPDRHRKRSSPEPHRRRAALELQDVKLKTRWSAENAYPERPLWRILMWRADRSVWADNDAAAYPNVADGLHFDIGNSRKARAGMAKA